MIEIQQLSYEYSKKNPVLSDLNFQIKPGNIYGLLGENGVGKTTLLSLISGLTRPTIGKIEVSIKDSNNKTKIFEPFNREDKFLENIFYLPEFLISPKVSLKKYVALYSPFYPNFSQEDLDTYTDLFKVVSDTKLNTLSFGQQKKAMVAFALACNTQILLLDEPTIGLDIPSKVSFRKVITMASTEDKCIVISSHQVRELENIINPIIILQKNNVLLNNSIEEISKKLWFGTVESLDNEEQDGKILYYEDCIGGYYVVKHNIKGENSKLNIEFLFNAALNNEALFKILFIDKSI